MHTGASAIHFYDSKRSDLSVTSLITGCKVKSRTWKQVFRSTCSAKVKSIAKNKLIFFSCSPFTNDPENVRKNVTLGEQYILIRRSLFKAFFSCNSNFLSRVTVSVILASSVMFENFFDHLNQILDFELQFWSVFPILHLWTHYWSNLVVIVVLEIFAHICLF